MEAYEESVRSVDAALRRLNATLASYNLAGKKQTAQSSESSKAGTQNLATSKALPPNVGSTVPNLPAEKNGEAISGPTIDGKRAAFDANMSVGLREIVGLRATKKLTEIGKGDWHHVYAQLHHISALHEETPYCVPLYIVFASTYLQLGYPDLAAGEAYKALLLSDAVRDSSDDFHEPAFESLRDVISLIPLEERIALLKTELGTSLSNANREEPEDQEDVELDVWLREHYLPLIYRLLSLSLWSCGCLRSAHEFSQRGLALYPNDSELQTYEKLIVEAKEGLSFAESGKVRREVYPWNNFEVDRKNCLDELNEMMTEVAPKLEIREVKLPALHSDTLAAPNGDPTKYSDDGFVTQLGVFAKEDIAPGERILEETSFLTVNNRLLDALCDACSGTLPDLSKSEPSSSDGGPFMCDDCEAVFCSLNCRDKAMELYHPIVCDRDINSIAKDVPVLETSDALYTQLLLRVLAMAEQQGLHPLEVPEVRFIWGDFHPFKAVAEHFQGYKFLEPASHGFPRSLPFDFEYNVRLPFHALEKMDIDYFADARYAVWIFNTLFAKFRGTASARLSGKQPGTQARGPEVCAVHPMWCMANHSCDPNVTWEWGSSINLWAMEERQRWERPVDGQYQKPNKPGITKGEEILNHYCDPTLGIKQRRGWAQGALGGKCMCSRCEWEEQDKELDSTIAKESWPKVETEREV
ncbi:Hypothetical protein R9X50_00179300 [Acrodontium crateriforme]|uniref:SET domain-containing protein n=1 Tax=Acrodontium crateriforme TaxID=150365 RepID=A0AAQ3LZL6_9PEZI|nr:Hypothetical protein R9X50_00179300 [Acrodontium crateriforme]